MPRFTNESTNAVTGETTVERIEWDRDSLAALLAEVRYDHEVAGITVGGIPISTERGNERTTWQQLMLRSTADTGFSIRKKLSCGFVMLNASQCLSCGMHGANYIAACFAVEDVMLQQIAMAETAAELDAIEEQIRNPDTWPNRVY